MICFHSCPQGQLGTRDVGGMNVYVRALARGLSELMCKVDVYTRAHNQSHPSVENMYENVRLIHIGAGPIEDLDKTAMYSHMAEFEKGMASFTSVDGAHYDLIHSHYWLSGLVGQHLSDTWGVPQVVTFHTIGAIKNSLPIGEREPEIRLVAERDIARACRRLIATTENEKSWLTHVCGVGTETVSVVPCGIDLGLFRPVDKLAARKALGLAAGDKIVIAVGRIEPQKGLGRLIECFSLLTRPDLRLLIIGGDIAHQAEVEGLKSLAAGLGVGGRVEFLGNVSQEDLATYYSAADVTVVASYYESFCLVILESLACGTPVVSTRVGIAPTVLSGTNGCVADDGTPRDLAQAITQVIDGHHGLEAIRVRRATAANYDWSVIAKQVTGVYKMTISPEVTTPIAVDGTRAH